MPRLLLIALFLGFLSLNSYSWDDVGHKITGYIAWQRMSPVARENVVKLLRSAPEDSHLGAFYMNYGPKSDEMKRMDYFVFVPTWADAVRDRAFPVRYEKSYPVINGIDSKMGGRSVAQVVR